MMTMMTNDLSLNKEVLDPSKASLARANIFLRAATRYAEMALEDSPNKQFQLAAAKEKASKALQILETL